MPYIIWSLHERPRIDLAARNAKTAYGAARSARMDFSAYERVDDFKLNEILWRAIKGKGARAADCPPHGEAGPGNGTPKARRPAKPWAV